MKRLNKFILAVLVLSMTAGFAAYGSQAAIPAPGEYTLFGVENMGYLVASGELEMESVLTLSEDGTGFMTMDEDGMSISSWTQQDNTLSLEAEDGSVMDAELLKPGLLKMTIFEGYYLYYAQEGTDVSSFELLTREEVIAKMAEEEANKPKPDSALYALYDGLKPEEGLHLNYDVHVEKLETDTRYDVHCKDGIYYSAHYILDDRLPEHVTATFFQDGNAYTIYPGDMTGILATTTDSDYVKNHVMEMDDVFSAISKRAPELEYIEEEREMDGIKYLAEIYPANEAQYLPEAVFLFDDEGNLAYYIVTTSDILGELTYKVNAIDHEVDEALLDISGYEIEELQW